MTMRQNRAFVVLHLPTKVPDLIQTAKAIIAAAKGNPAVPNPNPPLAKLRALIVALDKAETATATRTIGTVPARDEARAALRQALNAFKAHVQRLADLDQENAAAIITSVAMSVRKESSRRKAAFVAKTGRTSGSVILEVRAAAKRASYGWQWSVDGGKTWIDAGTTLQAKTTITGLPVAKYVQFRYRAVTKNGVGDWSDPITFMVR
jgi:hypothetical protein